MFEEGQSLCSKKDIPYVRRRTFLVFDEGHPLCSKKNIPCVRRKTFLVSQDDETPIFGRTDLRKSVSEAKFDAETDFDVKKCLAPPKSAKNHEKPTKNCEKKFEKKIFFRFFFFDSESFETRFGEVWRVKNCEKTAKKREKFAKIREKSSFS